MSPGYDQPPTTTAPLSSAQQALSVADAARALAVETLIAERRLIEEWLKLKEQRRRLWYSREPSSP
jgi:hypothetical protein